MDGLEKARLPLHHPVDVSQQSQRESLGRQLGWVSVKGIQSVACVFDDRVKV
jgi:hypothetical protein